MVSGSLRHSTKYKSSICYSKTDSKTRDLLRVIDGDGDEAAGRGLRLRLQGLPVLYTVHCTVLVLRHITTTVA